MGFISIRVKRRFRFAPVEFRHDVQYTPSRLVPERVGLIESQQKILIGIFDRRKNECRHAIIHKRTADRGAGICPPSLVYLRRVV